MNGIIKNVVIILLLGTIYSCNAQNDEKEYEPDMSNVKKKASIMVYQAVVNGDNVSKGAIADYVMKDINTTYYNNSTIYYDANNHEVYASYCGNNAKPYRTVKTNWYSIIRVNGNLFMKGHTKKGIMNTNAIFIKKLFMIEMAMEN